MGLRFRRSVRLLPGVRLNFSGSGISTSIGVRGAHVTIGHGHVRQTVGIPGTGISYTTISRDRPGQTGPSGGIGIGGLLVGGILLLAVYAGLRLPLAPTAHNEAMPNSRMQPAQVAVATTHAAAIGGLPLPESREAYVVAVDALNERDRPNGAVIGSLHRGASVDVFETTQGWVRISSAGHPQRWVSARLLCKVDACAGGNKQ